MTTAITDVKAATAGRVTAPKNGIHPFGNVFP